ncbi:PA14 domain-containing protein [Pareuzebyella sediminis]|uniref:PA14 domain-containing protein n=1 Tax=Pareuzebyella sediminis TaxID=2607998 RepID=UPI0011EE7772|nr:PA14 domain-containing protein [Pareuzebyella sediminis]
MFSFRHFFLLILVCSFSISVHGQLSDLHYLPPLKQGQNNGAIQQQAVYLSTPETSSFTVNVYRGTSTTSLATFTISNVAPAVYNLPNGDNNITLVDNSNTGVVLNNGGLRFEAPGGNKFYVNYRGRSGSQAASLTTKGRVAMGTNFKWGGVPNLGSHVSKSNTLGIMATQDNTTITLSGYDPNCEFRVGNNRAGITDNSYTITLDENESFVFETYIGNSPTPAHERGWIGASIVSDQAIVISNGSLNYGRQAGNSNRDAGIDQPVPENRLGKEYVFVRGNGNSNGWTEFPLIIATENNTQIFVNGSATSIATLNEGDFYEIASSNYSSNSVGANMYVETSKDVYAYQCVGGSTAAYTQGLNFVAPVNCLLPDTMDNIPSITDAAGVTITGGVTIIAATSTPDANITVTDGNGTVALPASSPITGTTDWKTFYLPSLTGNVSVQSSGPIAVGFFGFNGARGVAGYYSGFDTLPDIDLQITGNYCLPGTILEIASGETFDAYQWYGDGVLIPGETSASYTAATAGDYYLRVTRGPCSYDSNSISVYYCNPDIVVNKTANVSTLNEGDNVTFTITVENLGIDPTTNLTITDIMPSRLSIVSTTPSAGSWTSPDWNVGTLNSGQLETLTIAAIADTNNSIVPAFFVTNTASNSQDQTDNNITTDNPSVSLTIYNDYDNDGVIDIADLDDDNDGVYDDAEANICAGGLDYEFYDLTPTGNTVDNIPLTGSYATGTANNVNVAGLAAIHTPGDGETYSVRYTGYIEIENGGSYTFYTDSDDGSKLYIDANLVVDNDGLHGIVEESGTIALSPGLHWLEILFFEFTGGDNLVVQYQGPSIVKQDIPFSILFPASCGSDTDGFPDHLDLDADDDSCSDANEAYTNVNADGGDDGVYGSGVPAVNANGTVIAATYTVPEDIDSNGTYEFQEAGATPTITLAPADTRTFVNTTANLDSTDNGDAHQWQVSTDGGITFTDILDGPEYSGTTTNTLNIIQPGIDKNGNRYRVIITSDTFICGSITSTPALLNVSPATIITNRRITYRVNKN